ncbi:hypothetical protein RSUY_22280 [Ralstonia solanacearum]|nr:hypothetical protein RSUY_22280 [Ralstonia solanacearum]
MEVVSAVSRRYRRYHKIAARHLPEWAPSGVTLSLIQAMLNLRNVRCAKRNIHENDDGTQSTHAEHLRYAEAEIARLVRLCAYSNEMQKAWRTISTMPARGGGDPAFSICSKISSTLGQFGDLPKRLPAQRKKSLSRVAKAVDDLLEAIESESEAQDSLEIALIEYLGGQNLKMRSDDGEEIGVDESLDPFRALSPAIIPCDDTEGLEDSPHCSKPWHEWSSFDRYGWLHDEVSMTGMAELLIFCRDRINALAQEPPKILQPGRPDGGLQPFLIRSLSNWMKRIYGQPLDDSVALLVSATLDLPEPLTREAIRPYLKGTGKISSRNR